jgi:hypothetical protein
VNVSLSRVLLLPVRCCSLSHTRCAIPFFLPQNFFSSSPSSRSFFRRGGTRERAGEGRKEKEREEMI